MTTLLFANNAKSTLAGPISNVATTLSLASGTGALFPNPGTGQAFMLTLTDAATGETYEIMQCTSRVGDVCTVVRAQEGTTALNWAAGDFANNFLTAGTAALFPQVGAPLGSMAFQNANAVAVTGGSVDVATLKTGGVPVLVDVMTTKGDLTTLNGAGAVIRQGIGANDFALIADSTSPSGMKWAAIFTSPMTTKGDIIGGGAAGAATRVPVGSDGQVLTADSTQAAGLNWTTTLTNPMTTLGDLIVGGVSGAPARLAVGADGFLLTADSTQPDGLKWAAGLTNPMTTLGDVIVGGTAGAAVRLGAGSDGQVLTSRAAATNGIDWETPPASVITTKGDLIAGGAGGTAARLAVGSNGQLLRANSAATDGLDWETLTVTDMWSSLIRTVNNETLTLVLSAGFAGTITQTTTQSASGTCTMTFKINGTALGGTANAVSSTLQNQAQATANTFVAGDKITVTISANASCVDAALSIRYTRNL